MTVRPLPLATQSYELRSRPAAAQRMVNLFPERLPEGARSPFYLKPTAGLTAFKDTSEGPIYAAASLAGSYFCIGGNSAYRLQDDALAAPTFLGTVGALPAGASFFFHHSIAVGLVGVVFCVPPRAYVADYAGNPIQQITTGVGDWPADGASSVAYLDGYYVFSSYTGDRMYVSNILDPTHYDALSYVRISSTVDYIMKLVAFNGELWVFGQNAVSAWYNNGNATAPFSPRAGATIRHGLGSARTVVELDGSLWWLGVDNCVYRTVGYQAKRVSDHAIEELIADFNGGYLRTAVACGFVHEGHIFYALSLPEAGITLVYDATTGVWHERSSAADAVGRWNINTATFLGARGLYGSSLDGKLYEMESGVYTEAGVTIPRLAVLPPVVTHGPRASMSRLEVEMEVGTGSPSSVFLDWSDDGGINWRTPRTLSTGSVGARNTRVATTRLGSFRQRLLRFYAAGPLTVYSVDADIQVGSD
jgi:hypothetical protein